MKAFDVAAIVGLPNLAEYVGAVERQLGRVVTTGSPWLDEPLARILSVRGKRLRPAVVAAASGGGATAAAVSGGVAVELVHLGSLVHDDIIDGASTRWNIPTISEQEGLDRAIIVGDLLFAKAGEVAADISGEVAEMVARVTADLCVGQGRELADQHNLERTEAAYRKAIGGKSAALIAAACRIGGWCGGLDRAQVTALGRFGEAFGVAFQLLDDVLDLVADPARTGKPAGRDAAEGVYTLPVILALQSPVATQVKELLKQPEPLAVDLVALLNKVGAIEQTLSEVKTYNRRAATALKGLKSVVAPGLADLPEAYTAWALEHLVAKEIV